MFRVSRGEAGLRRTLFIVICLATLAGACWERHAESNDRRAYFVADGNIYRVELTGWRFPLVHDPLALLIGCTRRATLTLDLARLEGPSATAAGGNLDVIVNALRERRHARASLRADADRIAATGVGPIDRADLGRKIRRG
jgi:hypothetical protein